MIIDVRDYRVAPGMRDRLVERCESLLFDEQERLGARFLGAFCDADDPNRFIFLRAMTDLAQRKHVLTAFYANGETWRAHRDEVNSWLENTDSVLLVRPVSEWAPPATGPSVVSMYTHLGSKPLADTASSELRREVADAVAAAGGRILVTLATDPAENNYPAHPIRTGEHGLIWLATFAEYRPLALHTVTRRRLHPTARSRLR